MRLTDHPDPRMWWLAHAVGLPFVALCLLLGLLSMWGPP